MMQQIIFRTGLALAMAWLSVSSVAAADNSTVILTNGTSIAVINVRWNAASKAFLAQPANGKDMTMTFYQRDVSRVDVPKPPELLQAEGLLQAKRNLDAIAPLERVITNYRMLGWDNTAREWLARIYVQNRDPDRVIFMVDEMMANGGGKSISATLRQEYWKALVDSKQVEKAAKDMDDAIATGSREVAAVAQVRRGDIRRAAGRKDDALEDYVRTILFFEAFAPVRAEALFKAAEILEEKGETAKARELLQTLIQQYPNNERAKQAEKKLS